MSVIEHWLVYDDEDPDVDGIAVGEEGAGASREAGYRVEGPFVPAEKLQGAVSDRTRLLEAVEYAARRFDRLGERNGALLMREALHLSRGQSLFDPAAAGRRAVEKHGDALKRLSDQEKTP